MKQIAKVILTLFILLIAMIGFIESPWGKKLALHLLSRALKQSGLTIQVGTIEGSLPQKMILKDLEVQSTAWKVNAQSLEIDLSILRLFKREISVRQLKGEGILWSVSPDKVASTTISKQLFPYSIHIRHFDLTHVAFSNEEQGSMNGSIRIERTGKAKINLHVEAPLFSYGPLDLRLTLFGPLSGPFHGEINGKFYELTFSGALTNNWNATAHFDGHVQGIPHVAPLAVKVDLSEEEQDALKMHVFYETARWTLGRFPMEKMRGEITAVRKEALWQGSSSTQFELYNQPWDGQTDFTWIQGKTWILNSVQIHGPTLYAKGNGMFRKDGLVEGQSTLTIGRLQALEIPFLPLFGSFEAKGEWQVIEGEQRQRIEAKAGQLFFKSLFAESLSLKAESIDPFFAPKGPIHVDIQQGKWRQLELTSFSIDTSQGEGKLPFQLMLSGKWKHPLELKLGGHWIEKGGEWEIDLESGSGIFYNHPLALSSVVTIQKSTDQLLISPAMLQMGDGTVNLFLSHQKKETEGRIEVRHLPIDMLSLNPLDLSIGGTFDLNATATEKGGNLQAKLEATVSELEVLSLEEAPPFRASGMISAEYDKDRLRVKSSLSENKNPWLELFLNLPIRLEMWPIRYALFNDEKIEGRLDFQGNVEDICDFFDLGTHYFQGMADCHFSLSNTFANPTLKGSCNWTNGSYQNYYTGTQLKDIQAEWVARGNVLALQSLTAQDYQNKGRFSAKGKISLLPEALFPFDFQLSFDRLNCIEIDLVAAEASGEIEIVGNLKEATTKGDLSVLQSILTIPDHIPRPIPKLQVVYRNPIHPITPPSEPSLHPYPLHLDLNVTAPEGIFISGRGLNSEWKGNFSIGGTFASPAAKGKLQLIKGDFVFASRRFKLSDGTLSLSGKEHEMPNLNIAAAVEEKGVLITARLKGPLNQPQLTFQSVPPLPMSSILAILIFGEDLSEINGVQALQIANAIANVAGEGPDILENTRKTIGVDRLRIITVPSGAEEGENAIALQVGKYVAQGVIISISQGAEDNSSNISIELELKYGFSFLAETQQQQEQGKFTLKWNLNY